MKKVLLLQLVLATIISGCCILKKPDPAVESWQDTPHSTTNKIKVSANLSAEDLKDYYLKRVLQMGFRVDTSKTYLNNLVTEFKRVDSYYVKVHIEFIDTTAIISGNSGNRGLNSYYTSSNDPIGTTLKDHDIAWTPINPGARGWDQLELLHRIFIPRANTEVIYKAAYNKFE